MSSRMVAFAPAGLLLLATADPSFFDDSLKQAESQLLRGEADAALATLAGAGSTPRRLRLEADAHVLLQDPHAEPLLAALARHPGWEQHALRQQAALLESYEQQDRVRLGSILFALTIGLLILTGGRELLVLRIETIVVGIAFVVSLLIAGQLSKPLMTVFGVVAVGGVALVHAGAASVRRTAAPPRVRTMVAASMMLGFGGILWAVGHQIGLGGLFGLLARATSG